MSTFLKRIGLTLAFLCPFTARAVDAICPLHLRFVGNAKAEAISFQAFGYQVLSRKNIAPLTADSQQTLLKNLQFGETILIQNGPGAGDFSLYYRPLGSADDVLILDNADFARAFSDRIPSCQMLRTFGDQYLTQKALTLEAIQVVNGQPSPKFGWGPFILGSESKMYLRDGYWVDGAKLSTLYTEVLRSLPSATGDVRARLDAVLAPALRMFLPKYCLAGNSMSSAFLNHCAACQGQTDFIISLLEDSKFAIPAPYRLGVQIFNDHVRPVLWDGDHHQFWDLIYGGDAVTNVSAPIYAPEVLLDYLLRSPFSALSPLERQKLLPPDDQSRWLIKDRDGGPFDQGLMSHLWQRLTGSSPRVPPLVLPQPLASGTSAGLNRFLNAIPSIDYNGATPALEAVTRQTLTAQTKIENYKKSSPAAVPPDLSMSYLSAGTVHHILLNRDFGTIARMLKGKLAPADRQVLQPLRRWLYQPDPNRWTLSKIPQESIAEVVKIAQPIGDSYSTAVLAKAMGESLAVGSACGDDIGFLNETLMSDIASLSIADDLASAELSDLRVRWWNLTLKDRALAFDRLLTDQWEEMGRSTFPAIQTFLNRPVDSGAPPSAADWARLNSQIQRVTRAVQLVNIRNEIFGPSLPFKLSLIHSPNACRAELWMTRDLRDLLISLYHHSQALADASQILLANLTAWTPEQISGFLTAYKALGTMLGMTDVTDLESYVWPSYVGQPVWADVHYPLEPFFDKMIHDPQYQYGVQPSAKEQALLAQLLKDHPVQHARGNPISVTLPKIDFGRNVCAGHSGLVQPPGSLFYVECPDPTPGSLMTAALSPVAVRERRNLPVQFLAGLLLQLPMEYLTNPPTRLFIAMLWSDQLGTGLTDPADIIYLDHIEQMVFAPTPFLTAPDQNGLYYRVSLADFKECYKPNLNIWYACLNRFAPVAMNPINTYGLMWDNSNPLLQTGYFLWLDRERKMNLKASPEPVDMKYGWSADAPGSWAVMRSGADIYIFTAPGNQALILNTYKFGPATREYILNPELIFDNPDVD